jgi:hypothetical protein
MGSGGWVKRPGREADHSPPSRAEVKNASSYTPTPQYVFMAWCLDKHSDNFIFTFQPQRNRQLGRSRHRWGNILKNTLDVILLVSLKELCSMECIAIDLTPAFRHRQSH